MHINWQKGLPKMAFHAICSTAIGQNCIKHHFKRLAKYGLLFLQHQDLVHLLYEVHSFSWWFPLAIWLYLNKHRELQKCRFMQNVQHGKLKKWRNIYKNKKNSFKTVIYLFLNLQHYYVIKIQSCWVVSCFTHPNKKAFDRYAIVPEVHPTSPSPHAKFCS